MSFELGNFLETHEPKNGRFLAIAIDGRGGSGKSSLLEYLAPKLAGAVLLQGDDYFEPVDDPVLWGNFNDARFKTDVIEPLQQGSSFAYKPYDWHAEPHITERPMSVDKIFCLERCYSFDFELDWDLKIWVETPKDICLQRGMARDNGLGEARSRAAWDIWQQREDDYIRDKHLQQLANVIIDGTKPFSDQL